MGHAWRCSYGCALKICGPLLNQNRLGNFEAGIIVQGLRATSLLLPFSPLRLLRWVPLRSPVWLAALLDLPVQTLCTLVVPLTPGDGL